MKIPLTCSVRQRIAPAAEETQGSAVIVSYHALLELCTSALLREGVPEDAALVQARQLVEADARNHPSHGVQRLETLVQRIRNGVIESEPRIVETWVTPAVLTVDAGQALGPVAAMRTVDLLTAQAPSIGIVVGAIRNNNHIGMLSPYVERIAELGLIGIALTTSEALVHPWGGSRAMVGTNPIGVGVPSSERPMVVDMATAEVSMGKLISHRAQNKELGSGWAVDETGAPTLDPARALNGALSPFGGAKGYALALAFETLVASLSGTALGDAKHGTLDTDRRSTKGDVFAVLDPRVFNPAFSANEVGDYLDSIRSSPARPGSVSGISVPGDRSSSYRSAAMRSGIAVADDVWADLQKLTNVNGSNDE